jgi:hypothetical protein
MSAIIKKPMSDNDIRNFCKKNNYPYHMITLSELNKNFNDLNEKYYFIFTGDKEDEYNKGNTHHFFLTIGNHYFDSYGNIEGLKVPEDLKLLKTHPKQLQEFYNEHKDSVCGEYCCLFLKCVEDNLKKKIEEIPTIFVDEYGLGKNRHENDEIIAQAFTNIKTESDSSSDDETNKKR